MDVALASDGADAAAGKLYVISVRRAALTVDLSGGVLPSILVLPPTIHTTLPPPRWTRVSMHLPADGIRPGALLAGTATLSPLRWRQRWLNRHSQR